MKNAIKLGCIAGWVCLFTNVAVADPKPKGARNADPPTIANALAGNTYEWKSCKGGIYYGGKWKALAWCDKDGPSIGIGTWSVNGKSKVCNHLTWYWKKGNSVGSKRDPVSDRNCDEHVVDSNGKIWRSRGGDEHWWEFETNPGRVKGFKYKSKINRLRKKLGV